MPAKKKTTKKKEPTWDDIGRSIGQKIEKSKFECSSWKKPWVIHENHGGGFGRLLFIIAVLLAADAMGYLQGVSTWIKVLLVIGFALMKF